LLEFKSHKTTSLVAAVREDIDGNEEEDSECSRRYTENGSCDISSPILAENQNLSQYGAMVNPTLLALPKSSQRVLVLHTWDSSSTISSRPTEPITIVIRIFKEILIQLIKYQPL
jgi:hypothetical protein